MNTRDYYAFVERWIRGIKSELQYWDQYVSTNGYGDSSDFAQYTAKIRPFIFDDLLYMSETEVIDVGSGPFSICGTYTTKTKLNFTAVDLMAPIYKEIKNKYHLITEVDPEFAILERLTSQFGVEKYDIVHMSNSLDHTFDPMAGIWQLLGVCKVNGFVVLQHHQNEAEAAKYEGLHQWNCTLQNGKFEIWNKEIVIDVAEELGDTVEITLERHAPMDTVILKKIKPFVLKDDTLEFVFESVLVQELERKILSEYYQL